MKFVYPIKEKTAEDLYRLNREGHGGFYPLGTNFAYHGGMHFEGELPIVAISDGSIIAYRYKTEYITETVEGESEGFKYSNCFILLQHKYTTPKTQELIFYSLYNHLLPWGEMDEEQKSKINAFGKQGYEIINAPNGLTVRSSMVSPSNDNKVGTLGNGAKIVASKVDETWAKIEEGSLMGNYFCHTHNGNQYGKSIIISGDPELDEIISCSINIKAGDLLGYTGLYEAKGIQCGYKTVHVEVFSDDNAERFIKNEQGDGKPTHIVIPKDVQLKKKSYTYSDIATIGRISRMAGTVVEIVEPDNGGEWVHVQDKQVFGKFKRSSLIYDAVAKFYTVQSEFIEEIRGVFEKVDVTEDTKFYWVAGGEPDLLRTIRTETLDAGAKYWIARTLLNNDVTKIIEDSADCYEDNPGDFTFEDGDKTTEEKTVEIGMVSTLRYEGGGWYGIESDGWVSENDVKIITPYDWPGFKVLKEEEASPFLLGKMAISKDLWADYGDFPLFFQKLVDEIDTNNDRKISLREIQDALKNEETARRLSRIISVHPSEWSKEHWDNHWTDLRGERADNLKQRVEELCWWQSVKDKLQDNGGFLASPIVYHWNPVAFVEHMISFVEEEEVRFYINRPGAGDVEVFDHTNITDDDISNKRKIFVKEGGGSDKWKIGNASTLQGYRGLGYVGKTYLKKALIDGGVPGIPDMSERWKRIWGAIWWSEGCLEAINQYDSAFLSFGPIQQTIGKADGQGELSAALAYVKSTKPDIYEKYFGRHGLEPVNVAPSSYKVEYADLKLNGTLMKTPELKNEFRKFIWGYRCLLAMNDPIFRKEFLGYGFRRLEYVENMQKIINGKTVIFKNVFKSELAHALVLDAHINVPGKVDRSTSDGIWVKALRDVKGTPAGDVNIESITQDDEYAMIKRLLVHRENCAMWSPKARAAMIILCCKDLSDSLVQKLGYADLNALYGEGGAGSQNYKYNFLETSRS